MSRLIADGIDVIGAVRRRTKFSWEVPSPTLGDKADWLSLLAGRNVVIHAAARAHVLNDRAERPIDVFRAANTVGTLRLAEQSAKMGVQRFIFLSSVGVNGNCNCRPFTEADEPAPQEPYAVSKLEAEQGLMQLAKFTGMEIVILRPSLVYGPGAPGNFGRLLEAVRRGFPLPLGAVTHNRRSLLALDNLVDMIVRCVVHPSAANQLFLVADNEDLSTADLLRRLACALEIPLYLPSVPLWILSAAATMLGKRDLMDRLCGSLQVDITKAKQLLDWTPPVSVDDGLSRVANRFLEERKKS